MHKVLLIGGAGYIGSVVTDYLLESGFHVRSLDNFIYKNNFTVPPFINRDNYEFVYGDLRDKDVIQQSLTGIDGVVILAGLVGDPITKKYPDISDSINDIGIKSCIDVINGNGVDKLIFVSTCSNYGMIPDGDLADENYELKPLSLYAKAKVEIENHLMSLKGKVDYSPTILRFATAFGLSPRMRFDLSVSEFSKCLADGNELLIFDADTWRPYCHVKDFARLIKIVLSSSEEKSAFEIFNAGGDINNHTKRSIVNIILDNVENGKVVYKEHGGDPRNYKVNFNKVKNVLGFEPKYTVEDGVIEVIRAVKNNVFDNISVENFYGNYNLDHAE